MKKIVLALLLAAFVSVGAFADHPDGLGIGVVGSFGGWDGSSAAGYGLSLKVPSLPIYWGINLGFGSEYFKLGLTGDKYLYDQVLASDIGLHWFLGLGGFFNIFLYDVSGGYGSYAYSYSYNNMNFGARVPIGISFQPIPLLEIFLDIAPAIGLYYNGGYSYKYGSYEYTVDSDIGLFWDAPIEFGIRLWF